MDILGTLFGTFEKVKIMRLFLFNPEAQFTLSGVAIRTQTSEKKAKAELAILERIGMLKRKVVSIELEKKQGKKVIKKKLKAQGWHINKDFIYIKPLQSFLIDISPVQGADLLKRFGKTGKLKILIVSGIFIQNFETRLDVLIVGDGLRQAAIERAMRSLESEIGREIRYSAFETPDFKYRLGMYDKLVRDVLDYPHEVVIDKLGLAQ